MGQRLHINIPLAACSPPPPRLQAPAYSAAPHPAVRATQPPSPPPRGSRLEPQTGSALERPWRPREQTRVGPVMHRFPTRWWRPRVARLRRGGGALRLAPGSVPGETRSTHPRNNSPERFNSPVRRLRSPCASCNAPDGGSRYRRHLHCAPVGMHCAQKRGGVICCKTGGSEARGVRGGFS